MFRTASRLARKAAASSSPIAAPDDDRLSVGVAPRRPSQVQRSGEQRSACPRGQREGQEVERCVAGTVVSE